MSWGRRNRLSRIVDATSGRTNMLAVDHGYFLGPISGMRRPADPPRRRADGHSRAAQVVR